MTSLALLLQRAGPEAADPPTVLPNIALDGQVLSPYTKEMLDGSLRNEDRP